MIKAYKRILKNYDYDEVKIINLETGEFIQYMQDKSIGFKFSQYKTNIKDMGYKTVTECIKELKQRGLLGEEIDYKEQLKSEKVGLINLGIERIKRHNRINSKDFEDIILKLSDYGLGYCDAQNQIIATYQHSI
jgi:hypothetical protein